MQYRWLVAIGLVLAVLLLSGRLESTVQKSFAQSSFKPSSQPTNSDQLVLVDVSGAVKKPGVYSLNSNSRYQDAILLAGGLSDSADPSYLAKQLNLSKKVSDGLKIYIPFKNDSTASLSEGSSEQSAPSGGVVNINSASATELEALSGIGPVSAQSIINKRPFQSTDQLVIRKVISKSAYEKIKNMISI